MSVDTTWDGNLVRVTLNRPPANAMNPDFLDEIAELFERLTANSECHGIVLTGSGRIFSAGMDLKFAAGCDAVRSDQVLAAFNRAFAAVYGIEKPVIAAINGHAIAGGMVLALCCDYRIASRDHGLFGLTEVRVGVPFPEVAYNVIADQLPAHTLRTMIQFGENFDGQAALAAGAIDELVASEAVLGKATAKAKAAMAIPARGYATVKRQLRGATMARNRQLVSTGSDSYLGNWINDAARAAALKVLRG